MLSIQNYKKVESLSEAWELNQKKNNRILGGMMWMRLGESRINTAIDLSGLGLDTIEETDEEFKIGSMVTLRQLETNEGLDRYAGGCLKEALRHIVGVQFRNLATVGGSLYGRYGFSDVLTFFMGLDSYVELYKGGIVPLKEYAAREYDRDVLVQLIVKKHPMKMSYQAVRITETDLPVLTCAVVHRTDTNSCRVCVGARPGRAVLVDDAEGILAKGLTKEAMEEYARYARRTVKTESNMRGSAEYRSHLVEVLVRRGLEKMPEKI